MECGLCSMMLFLRLWRKVSGDLRNNILDLFMPPQS